MDFKKSKALMTMIDRVTGLMSRYPKYRGDKYPLISHVWWEELPERLKTPEVRDVLQMVAGGGKTLSASETISRSYRKVLELHPEWVTELHAMERRLQEQKVKNTIS